MDRIEQFIDWVEAQDNVERATRQTGRAVKVRVSKTDAGVPKPWAADGAPFELIDGEYHGDDYIITMLSGGGHAPGDQYVHRLAISPFCVVCDDRPQGYDNGLCGSCKVQMGLLTGPAGETAIVMAVHDDDGRGTMTDPGQVFEATADDGGVLRADLEYGGEIREDEPLNGSAHSIVRWKSNGDADG